jgi:ceramide glucosyltransferase
MFQFVFFLTLLGLASCTVFLGMVMAASLRFRRAAALSASASATPNSQDRPPVTLLKPLCGWEPRLEENLESFFRQAYPDFEIIFGTRNENDLALRVVKRVSARYPDVPIKIVFSGEPDHPNAKVCSLTKMVEAAKFDYFLVSDSDVEVTPTYIQEVIGPLLRPKCGLVTCLYRGVPAGGLWSRLEALGMSVEMTSGVIVAEMLEGMKFALGPTMAVRRDALDAIGGFVVLADYCSDDYELGRLIAEKGFTVALSSYVVNHIVINRDFRSSMAHQIRWMRSTRFSRPKGHLGSGLTFAMPFGVLGLVAGLLAHSVALAVVCFGWAFLNRTVMALMAGWRVVRDPLSRRDFWLYPLRDMLGFFFWIASFLSSKVVWRHEVYQLKSGGLMARVSPGIAASAARAVAIDDLS